MRINYFFLLPSVGTCLAGIFILIDSKMLGRWNRLPACAHKTGFQLVFVEQASSLCLWNRLPACVCGTGFQPVFKTGINPGSGGTGFQPVFKTGINPGSGDRMALSQSKKSMLTVVIKWEFFQVTREKFDAYINEVKFPPIDRKT